MATFAFAFTQIVEGDRIRFDLAAIHAAIGRRGIELLDHVVKKEVVSNP